MSIQQPTVTEEQIEHVERKLQAFYDGLSPGEKAIMQDILSRAAEADVVAHMPGSAGTPGTVTFTVGGRTMTVTPSGGGSTTDPDKGKDGATTAGQPGGTQTGSGTTTGGVTIKF